MSVLTIQISDEQHERLEALAAARGVSLNTLFEEFSTQALADFEAETHFNRRAALGDKVRGLNILGALDAHYSKQPD